MLGLGLSEKNQETTRNSLITFLLFLAFPPQTLQFNRLLCHKAHQLYNFQVINGMASNATSF